MMKSRMMIERPDDVEVTMKMTLTVREWCDLRDQLGVRFPGVKLTNAITDMLAGIRKIVYGPEDEEEGE